MSGRSAGGASQCFKGVSGSPVGCLVGGDGGAQEHEGGGLLDGAALDPVEQGRCRGGAIRHADRPVLPCVSHAWVPSASASTPGRPTWVLSGQVDSRAP